MRPINQFRKVRYYAILHPNTADFSRDQQWTDRQSNASKHERRPIFDDKVFTIPVPLWVGIISLRLVSAKFQAFFQLK